jgi:hypothetical protein
MQILYNEFNPNRKIDMKISEKIAYFANFKKAWLSPQRFARNLETLNQIMGRSALHNFTHISLKLLKAARNFTYRQF